MKWPSVALADVCEINVGRTPSRNEPDYWKDGVHPWASISDLGKQRFLHDTKERFSDRALRECNMRSAHPGTVLFSFKLSIGKVGIATRKMFTNEAIAALPPKDDNTLYAPYLAYALEAIDFSDVGSHAVMGRTLNKKSLAQIEIPLPPLVEQKRIAAILDQADALRRLRRRALDRLNTLGQAIFHEMFGDPSTNPKGWQTKPLSSLGVLERGASKHRPRNDPALLGGPHPLIQTGDVARAGDYITSYSSTYSELGLKQSRKWKRGTLCITIAANIADTAILDFEACFPDSVVGFDSGNPAHNFFVHRWFATIKGHLDAIAPAVAQKNINLAILRALPVINPDASLVEEFFNKERTNASAHALAQRASAQSDRLFTSLQHRAFRGEL